MTNMICLAMAYMGEPLRRSVVGRNKKVVFLSNLSTIDSHGVSNPSCIGFPPNCVFEYENSLYDKLLDAYESSDSSLLGTLWGQAKLLDVPI